MAKNIDYTNKDATVGREEGAPRFYTRGDQVYRQDVDDDGYLIPNDETHVDWRKTESDAMEYANELQEKENQFIRNEKKASIRKLKRR